jgi:hypothetical protein
MGTTDTGTVTAEQPKSKTKAVMVALGIVGAGFVVGLIINAIRKPCPCAERLGEPEASAEAVALAGAAMAQYPPLPDFGTERIPVVQPGFPAEAPPAGDPTVGAPFASNGNAGPEYPPPLPDFGTERIPVAPPRTRQRRPKATA